MAPVAGSPPNRRTDWATAAAGRPVRGTPPAAAGRPVRGTPARRRRPGCLPPVLRRRPTRAGACGRAVERTVRVCRTVTCCRGRCAGRAEKSGRAAPAVEETARGTRLWQRAEPTDARADVVRRRLTLVGYTNGTLTPCHPTRQRVTSTSRRLGRTVTAFLSTNSASVAARTSRAAQV